MPSSWARRASHVIESPVHRMRQVCERLSPGYHPAHSQDRKLLRGLCFKVTAKEMKPLCKVGCINAESASMCALRCDHGFKTASAEIDQDRCQRCGLCVSACPTGVISALNASEGPHHCREVQGMQHLRAGVPGRGHFRKVKEPYIVNEGKCIGCGLCIAKCPSDAIERIIS